MSDETARQIEYLIEVTQQDIQIKAGLLADVVEGEILVSEMLQDIKIDVADIKEGLFKFFEEEQDRFAIQQGLSKEQYFRTLEALREGAGKGKGSTPPAGTNTGQEGDEGGGNGLGALGTLGTLGAGLGLGALTRFVTNRFLPAATVAAAVTGVIDYLGSRPEILEGLAAEGLTGDDLEAEATTQTLGKVMSDFSDNVIEPLVEPIAAFAAKELGFNNQEIIDLRLAVNNLSDVFKRGTESLVDDLFTFFGREGARAAQRDDDQRLSELGAELREAQEAVRESGLDAMPGGEVDIGMNRLNEIAARRIELASAPRDTRKQRQDISREESALSREQKDLEERLAPVLEEQRIQNEIRMLQEGNKLSQAGYEAGDLLTAGQLEFAETPSDEKRKFFDDQINPKIASAAEAGAVDINEALHASNFFNPITYGSGVAVGVPLTINLDKLDSLSSEQLDALLINDDILNNSTLQLGALETSDRKIIETLYRMKTEGAADPRLMDAGGTIKPGEAAIVGEKGPELVFGPAEVVGREDTAELLSGSSPMLAGPLAAQVNQTTVQQPIPVIVTNAETAALSITPSPTISAAVPVNEMSSNMLAMSSAPVIISSTQGGSTVTNMVNNSSTNVIGGGAPARSSDVGHRRLQDRMQGVV